MDMFAIIGYLMICCFYPPQIWRVWRRKSAEDLSPMALWILFIGAGFLEYSMLYLGGYPVYWIGNGLAMLCCGVLLFQWYYYHKGDDTLRPPGC